MRKFTATLALCVLAVMLSVGGVSASFNYTHHKPDSIYGSLGVQMNDFIWQGSDILPDEEETGTDHLFLVQNMVDGSMSGRPEIGLNDPDSELNQYINKRLEGGIGWRDGRNYFGSMAVTGSEEMEAIFGAAAKGLSFIVEVDENDPSGNTYYIYTTDVYLGERGEPNWLGTSNKTPGKPTVPIGQYIEVIYRTKLVRPDKNSAFDIIETKKGKAKSDWYDENRSNANVTQIPAFDIETWVEIA